MKTKIIYLLLLAIVLNLNLVFLVNAEIQSLGYIKQNSCIQLRQTYSNSTYTNLTMIQYPNGSIDYIGRYMTKNGANYNYSFCNTTALGSYIYTTCTDVDGVDTCVGTTFNVNMSGYELTVGQSIIYFIGLAIALVLFILCLYFAITIPYGNEMKDEGFVSVSKIKYLKIFLIPMTYMFLLLIVGITRGITANLLNADYLSHIFNWIYWIMMSLIIPIMTLAFILTIIKIAEDNVINKRNKRGGFFR